MSSSSRRKIGLLVLVAVLLAPWSATAEPAGRAVQQGTGASLALLVRLWNAVAALWGDEGCRMDPFGRCGAASSPAVSTENLDNGCSMDPNGGCRDASVLPPPTENLDNGCGVDPYGGCGHGS
jgi:hypothetical protein